MGFGKDVEKRSFSEYCLFVVVYVCLRELFSTQVYKNLLDQIFLLTFVTVIIILNSKVYDLKFVCNQKGAKIQYLNVIK